MGVVSPFCLAGLYFAAFGVRFELKQKVGGGQINGDQLPPTPQQLLSQGANGAPADLRVRDPALRTPASSTSMS